MLDWKFLHCCIIAPLSIEMVVVAFGSHESSCAKAKSVCMLLSSFVLFEAVVKAC